MSVHRSTVEAPSNIAFIKYWGAVDLARAIPLNRSISMTLSRCVSVTTVEHDSGSTMDEVWLASDNGDLQAAPSAFATRVMAHVDRLRSWARSRCPDRGFGAFRVATHNSFPASAGIASSASGFCALTLATVRSLELDEDLEAGELSVLVRRSGSGSAARSVFGGFVEWPVDTDHHAARQIATAAHWELCDLIALVDLGAKEVSSLDGHRRATTSPHFDRRQQLLDARLHGVREAISQRSLARLGPLIEEDAIELHLIAMSSLPPIFYWAPATMRVLEQVRRLRADGVGAYATLDAGANVHVICEPGDERDVAQALGELEGVHDVLRDRVGSGPRALDGEGPTVREAGNAKDLEASMEQADSTRGRAPDQPDHHAGDNRPHPRSARRDLLAEGGL